MEVYISASYETCAARDPKGLYAKAKEGKIANFTGKDSAFEEPNPDDDVLVIDTEQNSVEQSVQVLMQQFIQRQTSK